MENDLFRQEAIEHRRDLSVGTPISRRRWIVKCMMAVSIAACIVLGALLLGWSTAPGQTLLNWIASHLFSVGAA